MKAWVIVSFLLLLVASCKNNSEVKTLHKDSFLAALSDSLTELPLIEEDTINTPEESLTLTVLNDAAFDLFEKQLTKAYGDTIYEAFAPYEKALDSCGWLTDTGSGAFLTLFESMVKTNNLRLTDSCSNYMTDEEIFAFGNLVTSFVNTVNDVSSERDKQSVGFALGNSIKRVVRTKNFTPKLLIDEITGTLGKSHFNKRICRLAAVCYLVSMVI